jgi:hypothetical protein
LPEFDFDDEELASMTTTIATFQAIRALHAGAREPFAIAVVASFRTEETYAATVKTTTSHRGEIMKILTRNFWQQAGAIAIRKFALIFKSGAIPWKPPAQKGNTRQSPSRTPQ